MWRIKALADPKGVLASDVILTRRSDMHLQSLKSISTIEIVMNATQCIEYCEPVCASATHKCRCPDLELNGVRHGYADLW
jgi:D-lactate dehydrogenase